MTLNDLIQQAPSLDSYVQAQAERNAEPWGRIVRFDTPDLPTFPLDLFDGTPWLRDFVAAVAEATQTPIDLSGMLALAVMGTCCQRWVMVVARAGWVEPTCIYVVTALPPASRKSAVFRAFAAPLLSYEQELAATVKQIIAETTARKDILEAQLESAKREAAKATRPIDAQAAMEKVDDLAHQLSNLTVPKPPRLIVDDVTPEALATLLCDHQGRMAALSPEGDVFAIMAGRYSGGSGPNFGVFLKAHAGDTLRVDRRNRSEFVDWPALTLGITTQPDVVRGLAEKAGFRGQGLLGRFLYALPDSLVGRRSVDAPPVPEEIRADYHRQIAALLGWRVTYSENCENTEDSEKRILIDSNTNTYYLSISIPANELLQDFLAWLEPHLGQEGAFGAFADWAGKLAGAAIRIAGLLHMAAHVGSHNSHNAQKEIGADTMARALAFTRYLVAHARAAFQEMGADPALAGARRALKWIEQSGETTFTKRDLHQGIKGTVARADDIDPILKILHDHGYVRPIETEREGRGRKPSQRYEVHPDLGSHNSHNSQNEAPAFAIDLSNYPISIPPAVNGYRSVDMPATPVEDDDPPIAATPVPVPIITAPDITPGLNWDYLHHAFVAQDVASIRRHCTMRGFDFDTVLTQLETEAKQ